MAWAHLGERFGKWPWEVEREPADKVEFYLNVIGCEAEMNALYGEGDPDDLIEIGGDDAG